MARVLLNGFETANAEESTSAGTTLATGYSFDNTVNTGYGAYSLKGTTTIASSQTIAVFTSTSRLRAKIYFRVSSVALTGVGEELIGPYRILDTGAALAGQVIFRITTTQQDFFFQSSTGVITASAATSLVANTWYRLDIDFQIGAGTGSCVVRLDGTQIINATSQNNGTLNVQFIQTNYTVGGGASRSRDFFLDDLETDDAAIPDIGYIIARQFTSGSPTYDSWTKNGGTNIEDVCNDTPFSIGTSISSYTASAAQTGFIASFMNTQSGHGNGTCDPFDVINGVKVGMVATTAATTAAGITVVGTPQVSSQLNGVDITLTFDGAPQAGDVVYTWGGHFTRASTNIGPSTAGYTPVGGPDTTTNNQSFGVWRKVLGTTPDANVVGQGTGNTSDSTAYESIVLRQVDTGTPEDATPTKNTGTTGAPDPAAIVVATNNAMVLATAGSQNNDATVGTQASYTQLGSSNSNDTNPMTIAGSRRTVGTGSENPPAWGSWANGQWVAFSVAVRPATEAGSAISIRYRLAGSNTDTAKTLTTANVYYETAVFTASLANLNSGEMGVLHGSSSINQTVYDMWAQISFTPTQGIQSQAVF